jgi:membrane-associated protein
MTLHDLMGIVTNLKGTLHDWAYHLGPRWSYLLLFAIVFCETGLVVAPFLPGDTMLFALGALAADNNWPLSFPMTVVILCVAANSGDALNYFLGYRIGPKVFSRESSWLLNKKHLLEAHAFYERHGGKTIIMARFIPFIRTFAPFVAGIGQMHFARFAAFSVTGGIIWVLSVMAAGYEFGSIPFVEKHFELVVIAIIVVSASPAIFHTLMARRRHQQDVDTSHPVLAPAAGEPRS